MATLTSYNQIEGLPSPRGPFSQAVSGAGQLLFVSGQGPFDPKIGQFQQGTIAEQTLLTLGCIERIVAKAGGRRENIACCRVYLQSLDQATFAEMNAAYEQFFGSHRPARTTVGAQLLGIDVEIDCIALLDP